MMEHTCQGMTLGDHSKAICTICGADLSKSSYSQLLEAIKRVRELHKKDWVGNCKHCSFLGDDDWSYPCRTIRTLDGGNDL
jgi:hypothetical protein